MAAQKRELTKLVVQAVVAVREGDRVVNEEVGCYEDGQWVPGHRLAAYTSEQASVIFQAQEAQLQASNPNRAARRGKAS